MNVEAVDDKIEQKSANHCYNKFTLRRRDALRDRTERDSGHRGLGSPKWQLLRDVHENVFGRAHC